MNQKKTCYIFAAGDLYQAPTDISTDAFIIAADGGLYHTKALGILPNVFLGDFDSADKSETGRNTVIFPTEKDYTDTFLAIEYGMKQGYTDFSVYGALGGKRIEHTVANIQSLEYFAKQNITVRLYGDGQILTAKNAEYSSKITFGAAFTGYISLFALGGNVEDLTIKGLKYPLNNATLKPEFPLGVSNEFCGVESEISFQNGTLLLIYTDSSRHG